LLISHYYAARDEQEFWKMAAQCALKLVQPASIGHGVHQSGEAIYGILSAGLRLAEIGSAR
jgi:hypothetical protein